MSASLSNYVYIYDIIIICFLFLDLVIIITLQAWPGHQGHVHLTKEGRAPPAHLVVQAPAILARIHLVAQLLEELRVPLQPSGAEYMVNIWLIYG